MSSIAIEYDHITIITVVPARNVAKVLLYHLVTDHISHKFVPLLKHESPADEPTTRNRYDEADKNQQTVTHTSFTIKQPIHTACMVTYPTN